MKNGRRFNLPQIIPDFGEPSRARTCDPLIKSQLLYQLSYRPVRWNAKNYTCGLESVKQVKF